MKVIAWGIKPIARCQLEKLACKRITSICGSPQVHSQGAFKGRTLTRFGLFSTCVWTSFSTTSASSLTAASCGGFLDFPATGKLGETPSARAERNVRSACKNAPASEHRTRTKNNGNLADLKETISRLSKPVREPKEVLYSC